MIMLIDTSTHCLIQGMTGKEGQRALKWMQQTGISVLAGVTPGKGGQEVDGIPVYNNVSEALEKHPQISVSAVYVPPKFVVSAVTEALEAGIKLLHILAEGVPTKDTSIMLEKAHQHQARIIGPSSIGFAVPGIGSIGSMGGGDMSQFLPATPEKKGVAILAKSGGMANTIANMLTSAKIPQSVIVGIGGDRFVGTTYADLLPELAADQNTAGVVIIGEIGGAYEEVLAQQVQKQSFPKPVIAFISGLFAETLPQGVAFGHAGAIVSSIEGTRSGKIDALRSVGAYIANKPADIVSIIQQQNLL